MDIAEFLRARLDEDEQVMREARRWSDRDWRACSADNRVTVMDGDGANVLAWMEADGEPGQMVGTHMARWDPAAVRRDIDAKRLIIREYQVWATSRFPDWDGGRADGLERALELLASAYAAHPDYDPAWKPTE